jgi:hypothetical protein
VDVEWDAFLDPVTQPLFSRAELLKFYPQVNWDTQISGTRIRPEVAARLARAWRVHLAAARGDGFRKVEPQRAGSDPDAPNRMGVYVSVSPNRIALWMGGSSVDESTGTKVFCDARDEVEPGQTCCGWTSEELSRLGSGYRLIGVNG